GSEDVDQALEPALALFQVVRDVGGEVGLLSVLAHYHAVLLVAELRGAKPGRSLLGVEPRLALEPSERAVDRAALLQRALGIPAVEVNPEFTEIVTDVGEHLRKRVREHAAERLRSNEITRPFHQRVDVVLARDLESDSGEDIGQRGSVRGLTSMPHVQWTRRIGRHEFEQYALSTAEAAVPLRAAVAVATFMDSGQLAAIGLGRQEDIDEAGAGDLRAGYERTGWQSGDDLLRQLPRLAAGLLGETQG